MRNILHVVTNVEHYGDSEKLTGLWLSELTHFLQVTELVDVGMQIVSLKGGYVHLDPRSLKFPFMDRYTRQKKADPGFMAHLDNSTPLAAIDPFDFDAVYLVGGHGAMWDFPDSVPLQDLCRQMYEAGKVIAAVCHGVCGLLNVQLSDGNHLLAGKAVTGYSWLEEQLAGVTKLLPFNLEEELTKQGGIYQKARFPFQPFVQNSGRIITGQNPQSAKETARATLAIL